MNTEIWYWHQSAAFPLLTTLTLLPALAIPAIVWLPSFIGARVMAFGSSGLSLLLSGYLLFLFDRHQPGLQLVEHVHALGMSYYVGVDGFNILFIPLAAAIGLLALTYVSLTHYAGDRGLIASIMAYQSILTGLFCALNLMQFWLWTVLELIPVCWLTVKAGTGSKPNLLIGRLLQYWGWSLAMTLTGFLLLGFGLAGADHPLSFDWLTLKENNAYLHDEILVFVFLFYGFAIRMPLFPFHGWLPVLAEAGSVAITGFFIIGVKLGIYGVVRFIFPLVPGVAENWSYLAMTLGLVGLFYGAVLAVLQINMRRMLAFAAISHAGLLVTGIFCFNAWGLEGSFLLSLLYGLSAAGLLFSLGLAHERTGTAYLPRLGYLFDRSSTLGLLFLASILATMAIPGTPAFDAIRLLIKGIIQEYGWPAALAVLTGNLLVAVFLLRAFHRMFLAGSKRTSKPYTGRRHPAPAERLAAVILCAVLIGIGFDTTPLLQLIENHTRGLMQGFPVHAEPLPEAGAILPNFDSTLAEPPQ
ncbi:MAG: NADH:quinone oxidoreductase [Methylobacter sp.]|nr:MAG: NADH:quinone oxidoreductase [Methylobacter sp.]